VHGPVIERRFDTSAMEPRVVPSTGIDRTSASRPVISPMNAHHSCTDGVSSPAQLTMVAGTLAASSRASTWPLMSSW